MQRSVSQLWVHFGMGSGDRGGLWCGLEICISTLCAFLSSELAQTSLGCERHDAPPIAIPFGR